MSRKNEIISILERNDDAALSQYSRHDPGLFRTMISLTYDKDSVLSWRAIEAMGRLSGEIGAYDPEKIRSLAQRLLWMLREESGNNPWSAPDMLGELVRNNPDSLADLAPIIASFHDEEILHQGVLRAMVRIGEVRPDLVADQKLLVKEYIGHADPVVRAYAVRLAEILKDRDLRDLLQVLVSDDTEVRLYEGGEFRTFLISELVQNNLSVSEETDNDDK